MPNTETGSKPKTRKPVSEEKKAVLRDNLKKAREAMIQKALSAREVVKAGDQVAPPPEVTEETQEIDRIASEIVGNVVAGKTPAHQEVDSKVSNHKTQKRGWLFGGNNKKTQVETVPAIVSDIKSCTEGIVLVEKRLLPEGAPKLLFGDQWVYLLVEIQENGNKSYKPFDLLDPKDDLESKLPPETLGMVTDFPEARAYYTHGKNTNEKLNMWLAIGFLIGLGILFFLVFTVGMG